METKVCKKCGVEKDLSEYNKDKYSKDGLRYRCRTCTRDEYKDFYYKNLDKEINRQIKYQNNNKEKVNKRRNKKHNENYYNDSLYKLKFNMRNRIKMFLKSSNINLNTNNRTLELVGCSPQKLKEHIEKQFKEGMSWDNYGLHTWHIDHIIPLSSAKTEEEVHELLNYSNLQPLWCYENYKKGKKIIE
jgi:hypothetical protein